MLLLELYNTRHEQSLQSDAVDSADQLNEYIPRRKDANYAEFAPGTQVTHSLLGPKVGTVVDVMAIPREDRRESGIPVQVGDRIYWMAPQGLTRIKGMAEGKKKKKKKSSRSLRGYFFPGYAYYGAGDSGEGGGGGDGGGESIRHGVAEGSLNELSKNTLKSYSRERGTTIHQDQRDADRARDTAADKKKHGNTKAAADWNDEASWLDKRAEKGAKGVAQAAIKIAKKGMAEGETKYDAAWDEKVQRLGQMAKQGERKTVWDPVRRVYKTVPVNTAKPTQENIFSLTEKNSITQTAQSVNEDSNSGAAEQAILNRIMTAHIDLLRQFGPEKVMQAVEEVAYNVGDLAEIGTSDVSGWVRQVRQILGA